MNNNYQNNNFQQNENQNQNQQAGQGFVMQPSPAAGQQGFQDQQNFQNSAPNPDPNAAPGMNPDGTPAPENAPAPKKPRKKMPLWLNRTIFAVLIAALAVGGGYAGTSLAYQQVDRVVVQRVETQTGTLPPAKPQVEPPSVLNRLPLSVNRRLSPSSPNG